MLAGKAIEKMILRPDVTRHDTAHFLKVYAYAKAIGETEGLDAETQQTLELAAIVHDIACPLCRKKYGNANGKYQEAESEPLVREFFRGEDMPDGMTDRISCLVCHHHTYAGVDGIDWQILLEADYLVNADENAASEDAVRDMRARLFKTGAGIRMLDRLFGLNG